MSLIQDWKSQIAVMIIVKQEILKNDKDELWDHHLPELAAKEEEISSVEKHLGYKLDRSYTDFLKYSNGWKCFLQTINLFGTKELLNSEIVDYSKKCYTRSKMM